MSVRQELDSLLKTLIQQRDEIDVQLHLAGMEAKELWRQSEPKWASFLDQLGIINDDSKEASAELMHAAKTIGDELKDIYQEIQKRLGQ
ncbi:hypothetical protein [Methylomarinum vadi]|uniref:hypothetical protein n=1 Tax=Methylomarinum vadi TaxID=438855 RepID=UPI0004DEEB6E|nr:hypothetical protein [Methylomarinum vadi]